MLANGSDRQSTALRQRNNQLIRFAIARELSKVKRVVNSMNIHLGKVRESFTTSYRSRMLRVSLNLLTGHSDPHRQLLRYSAPLSVNMHGAENSTNDIPPPQLERKRTPTLPHTVYHRNEQSNPRLHNSIRDLPPMHLHPHPRFTCSCRVPALMYVNTVFGCGSKARVRISATPATRIISRCGSAIPSLPILSRIHTHTKGFEFSKGSKFSCSEREIKKHCRVKSGNNHHV
jgi:hypothetical protein